MIDISKIIDKTISEGYDISMARPKACQDIFLKLLSESKFRKNITIKGGVVIRSLSNNIRRATTDIDIDFIRYSLNDKKVCLVGYKRNEANAKVCQVIIKRRICDYLSKL